MTTVRILLLSASLLLPIGALASPSSPTTDASPVRSTFNPGSQYTATLDQTHNQWRLQPADGQDVLITTGTCATGAMVPTGIWLLVLDAQGRPELLAPSVTRLPAGRSDRVALRACDQAHDQQLAVPQRVLDLLAVNTGAIYVDN